MNKKTTLKVGSWISYNNVFLRYFADYFRVVVSLSQKPIVYHRHSFTQVSENICINFGQRTNYFFYISNFLCITYRLNKNLKYTDASDGTLLFTLSGMLPSQKTTLWSRYTIRPDKLIMGFSSGFQPDVIIPTGKRFGAWRARQKTETFVRIFTSFD